MLQPASLAFDSHGDHAAGHSAHDAITVPDAHLLFSGDFSRAGSDLIISDHEHEFVVRDYFRGDHRPTLLSPEGAVLGSDVVDALTGHGQYAQAAPAQNAIPAIGRVAKVDGGATIIRNGVAITANAGDAVLKGDVLQTGAGGVLGVTFTDGSALNLTANSRLVVNDFVFDAQGSANSEILNLVQGSLSFISGGVAHSGGDMRITTPVATMGIRGTVGGVSQADDGTVKFFVVQSETGAVVIDNSGNVIAQVVQDGPLIQVRPTGPLQVVAEEINKSPSELLAELAALQNILNTQTIGKQIIDHFFGGNPNSIGTDHTQIQIDIPKSGIFTGGTGITNTGDPSSGNTATVTTTTTDQNGNTTTTQQDVPVQPNPLPVSSGKQVFWTGGGGNSDSGNNLNWSPGTPSGNDDVIIGSDQNGSPVDPAPVVVASGPLAAHSLTLSNGAQLTDAVSVLVDGDISIFGNKAGMPTGIFGDLAVNAGANLFMHATTGDAEIVSSDSLAIGNLAGNLTVAADVAAGQCGAVEAGIHAAGPDLTIGDVGGNFLLHAAATESGAIAAAKIASENVAIGDVGHDFTVEADAGQCYASAQAEILACGADLSIGNIGGNFTLSATASNGGESIAEIVAGGIVIGNVAGDFTVSGGADSCAATFAEISSTSGDLTIGNVGGDFLNAGLIDADNGLLSIGTVGGSFINDGVMRAYELHIAADDNTLVNNGKILVNSGEGGDDDDISVVGVDLHNAGFIKITDGTLEFAGGVHNSECGTILAHNGAMVFNAGVCNAGLIKASNSDVDFDAAVHNSGTIEAITCSSIHFAGAVDNCGTIEARSDSSINFAHWVGGNGTLALDGGSIELAHGTCNGIDFSGSCGGTLQLDCATASIGQIFGFGPDDSIDLYQLNDVSIVGYTADSSNTGMLQLHSCSLGDFYLSFTGDCTNYTVDSFELSCDGNGGTQITEAPFIDVLNQTVQPDSHNVTTVQGLSVIEPFAGNEQLTITATAGDGTLTFVDAELNSGPPSDTITEYATLAQINAALADGIIYTPNCPQPDTDHVTITIGDSHGGSEAYNLMFKVAGVGGVMLTATCGNDVMYGSGHCDSFVFESNQNGHDAVINFDPEHDVLDFDSSIFDSIMDALDSAHDDPQGNAVITTAHNGTITLDHVSAAALNSNNVAIHNYM